MLQRLTNWRADRQVRTPKQEMRMRDRVSEKTDLVEIFSWVSISHGLSRVVVQLHTLHVSHRYSHSCSTSFCVLTGPICLCFPAHTSAKINFSYSILFHLTTSYSSYFGGKKGISRNKTSFFLLM